MSTFKIRRNDVLKKTLRRLGIKIIHIKTGWWFLITCLCGLAAFLFQNIVPLKFFVVAGILPAGLFLVKFIKFN